MSTVAVLSPAAGFGQRGPRVMPGRNSAAFTEAEPSGLAGCAPSALLLWISRRPKRQRVWFSGGDNSEVSLGLRACFRGGLSAPPAPLR